MAIPDSVHVNEEWISEHYLTTKATSGSFLARLRQRRTEWEIDETDGHPTVRSRLRERAGEIARAAARLGSDEGADGSATRDLHRLVREVLGFRADASGLTTTRNDGQILVPEAVDITDSIGRRLVLLQAHPAEEVEDILNPSDGGTGAGTLLASASVDGKDESLVKDVVSDVFFADNPPPFLIVQAGRWVLVAERSRWQQGRWLAVDVGLVAERRDAKRAGEIEVAATLLGCDSFCPAADGTVAWKEMLEESVQHAAGVSSDLREGIRLSVETIANEVVARRRQRGLPVMGVPDLAGQLTRQALRFLYRILFVLFAENSAELAILPMRDPQYRAGYGIDRLRDLVLNPLTTDRSRHGTHLHESLERLFWLVENGHAAQRSYRRGADLEFRALRSDLFAAGATSLIDEVGLGNEALKTVLERLLLTKAKRGADRGFISYAELGINQLGAVYEGLMAYTGSFSDQDLYEVAPEGKADKGTWLLSASRVDGVPGQHLVTAPDPDTGEPKAVVHRRGTFVYRLSGRARQQSASYYTPESLTRSVVHHALAELLDQDGQRTPASDILRLTICEPALGSGAFAIEAVRQLAEEYLDRRQTELGERIPPDNHPEELRKVKAYLALHQVYGVDLNDTAVELAEVSLWLDTVHPELQSPWFGLHLRRGNSLIGARHDFYTAGDYAKKAWLQKSPTHHPLEDSNYVGPRIHHFLLPTQGWGAAVDTAEAKRYAPEAREQLRRWRTSIRSIPSKAQQRRLASLARRVETLWRLARLRLATAEQQIRRPIRVWGADDLAAGDGGVSREQVEEFLHDPDDAYLRLRRVMDAWCALWFWPVTARTDSEGNQIDPPGWDTWLETLESILGVEGRGPAAGQGSFGDAHLDTWESLQQAERQELEFHGAQTHETTTKRFGWLTVADDIARQQGFFHWELDFAPVFAAGGFDLQVGNPPWVRPDWDETAILADEDPWWQITPKPSEEDKKRRLGYTLGLPGALDRYLDERVAVAGVSENLGSPVDRPVLAGLRPDLYRCFMDRTWRSTNLHGIAALIHPESHFTEARAGHLRQETYSRLRRHWQYRNERKLFTEINDKVQFGVHIYGRRREARFLHAAAIYSPEVIDLSLKDDGLGPPPGVKDPEGRWDTRPHRERIIQVDEYILASWARLLDNDGTPALQARMLYPVNTASEAVLQKLADAPRLGSIDFEWTMGWNETTDRKRGYFVSSSGVPDTWDDVILQGPHFTVDNPLFQQPVPNARHNQDYEQVDLDAIGDTFIPRTNYQRAVPAQEFVSHYPKWQERPSNSYFRLAWRRMSNPANMRSMHAAILPPGPTHIHGILSGKSRSATDSVVSSGIWTSLVADFLVKASGTTEVNQSFIRRLPQVRDHALEPELILRSLRLNCLIREYTPLWEELFDPIWQTDRWAPDIGVPYSGRLGLGDVEAKWSWDTPLRRDADRRQALVEIDAIVAVMVGLPEDELATIYRTQFPVLQAYERDALYDANGRQVPREIAKAYRAQALAGEELSEDDRRGERYLYELPFTGVERERDLRAAHRHFSKIAEERSG